MGMLEELKKNIGKGIDINTMGGNSFCGILSRIIEPDAFEMDFCYVDDKINIVNIQTLEFFCFMDDEDTKKLKGKWKI